MKAKKYIVVGISGTGKSHFARLLHEKTGIPVFHMDSIIWKKNWEEATSEEVLKSLKAIRKQNAWIIEGWIEAYSRGPLQDCDTFFYLDFPGYVAAWGGLKRWMENWNKKRPELPEGCIETINPSFLWQMLLRKERPNIEQILANIDSKKIVRLESRYQATQVLQQPR